MSHKGFWYIRHLSLTLIGWLALVQWTLASQRPTPPIRLEFNRTQKKLDYSLHPPPAGKVLIQSTPSKVLTWPTQGNNKDFPKSTAQTVRDHFSNGIHSLYRNQYLKAKMEFGEALALSTSGNDSYALGEQLVALELYGLAEQAFAQAERQKPELGTAIREWKSIYFPVVSLNEEATQDFILAIHTEKTMLNDMERITALKAVTDTFPKFAPAWRWKAEWLTGRSYKMGALRKAVGLSPGHFPELESWGDGAMKMRLYSEAIGAYSQAKEIIRTSNLAKEKGWLDTISGKILQAEGSQGLERGENRSRAWKKIAEGLELQQRPLEAESARKKSQQR